MTANNIATEETTSLAELAQLCTSRAGTYSFLARLYRTEVDEALLDEMRGMLFPASTGNAQIDEGHYLITKHLSNSWDNALIDLAVDYARCFVGHGIDAFSAAYPFESIYTSEKRLLMQAARDEVLAIYRSEGLGKQANWREGEDHLAVELEFMRILCERCADALAQGDEGEALRILSTQRNFLSDHLISWTPMLTSDLRKFAKTGTYQGLALLTDGFLSVEAELLDDLLSEENE